MGKEQIINEISEMLQQIAINNREITQDEMSRYSEFLEEDFDELLEKNYDNEEMLMIFFLTIDFAQPEKNCKLIQCEDIEKNIQFFKKAIEENKIIQKYIPKFNEMLDELKKNEITPKTKFTQYDRVFSLCIHRELFNESDYVILAEIFGSKSLQLRTDSKTLESIIETYNNSSTKQRKNFESYNMYKELCKYYVHLMDNVSTLEINENSAISHFIRAAQKERIPKELSEIILDVLKIKKDLNPIIPVNEKDNLDEYMKKVATIRLHEGRMPRECCDFIIKQAILKNGDVFKYKGMMERALEDFTEYQLEDLNIDDYYVTVTEQHFLKDKKTAGQNNSKQKTIIISEQSLMRDGMFEALDTALHECTHAKQSKQIEEGKINGNTYKMLKENIIEILDKEYYYKNYENIYKEIHARENAYLKRIKVLKRIGLTNEQIRGLGIDNVKKYTLEKFRKAYAIDGRVKLYQGKGEKRHNGFMDGMFLEILQKKPGILESYPEFRVEFEKFGETIKKKSFVTILEECEQCINSAKTKEEKGRLANLYQEILLNDTPISENEQQEFEKLMAFESDNPIINAFKKRVLNEKFSPEGTIKYNLSVDRFSAFAKSVYDSANAEDRQKVQQDIKNGLQAKEQSSKLEQSGNNEERN